MPRSRREPPAGGAGDGEFDLQELLGEVRSIRDERDELKAAVEELRTATTAQQRRAAERDVRQAESGLAKALRDAGFADVSETDLEDLRKRRRQAEYNEWFEARLERMGAELEAEAEAAQRDAGSGRGSGRQQRRQQRDDSAGDGDDAGSGRTGGRHGYFG